MDDTHQDKNKSEVSHNNIRYYIGVVMSVACVFCIILISISESNNNSMKSTKKTISLPDNKK